MTNARNTPCEVIEREDPLRVLAYEIAHGTGGAGRFTGGDGLIRQLALTGGTASVAAATARVAEGPWGWPMARGGSRAASRANRHAWCYTTGRVHMNWRQ